MSHSGWTHLDVARIVKITDKAMLLELDNNDSDRHWVPLSQIKDPDDFSEGDVDTTVSITDWIAEKLEIE